ncbi:MAG: hypothetical protein QOF60_1139 [Actinomycetota bacterium]|jgi:hypothetical protein|nr:hypothetical protein [Actinomycetota bacterium]
MSTHDRDRDSGSALIAALMVMMVLSTLCMAVLSRTLVSMRSIKNGQNYDAALAAADAGVADALYKIDQTAPPTWSGTGSAGGGAYRYKADRRSDTEYWISSIGTVGLSSHGVRVKVTRSAKFPYAIFTEQDLTINGNNTGNIYAFNSLGGPPGLAAIGSNHQITISSGKGAGSAQHYYAPFGGCTGCSNPVAHTEGPNGGSAGLAKVTAASVPPGPTQPCPAGGVFSGTIDGMGGVPIVCSQDVAFTGLSVSVVNPPAILYVVPSAANPAPKLDIDSVPINTLGPARNLQIYVGGGGAIDVGNGNSSAAMTFSGAIYAPESTMTVKGGKWMTGSIVLNKLSVSGGPNFVFGYDSDLQTYYAADWTVSRYAEVPSTSLAVT